MAGKIAVTQVLCIYKQILVRSSLNNSRLYYHSSIYKLLNIRHGMNVWCSPVMRTIPRKWKCVTVGFSSKKVDSKKENAKTDSVDIDEDLESAAMSVASSLPGDQSKTKSDLLQQLRFHAKLTKKQSQPGQPHESTESTGSLGKTISGMKISRITEDSEKRSGYMIGGDGPGRRKRTPANLSSDSANAKSNVKLFQGPGLGIFASELDDVGDVREVPDKSSSLWDVVLHEELGHMTILPPCNDFEELIQLTKDGKLWKFPIDNEQGLEDEKQIGFHEHVFLENLIVDFPKKGPVRHFMELVINGLSKNPYVTVEQKRDHIVWFREYFVAKQNVLEEALGQNVDGNAVLSST